MRRAFLGRFLCFLPLAGVVIATNLLVDPADAFRNLRPGGFEEAHRIAQTNAAGQNVAGVWSYDERLVQRYTADALGEAPSVLVLGSSRMKQMHRPSDSSGSFLNVSVSGESMLDLLAIYHLFVQRQGPAPKILGVGLDPWLLGQGNPLDGYELADEYRSARLSLGLVPAPPAERMEGLRRTGEQLRRLISPTYFQLALKYLAVTRGQNAVIRATTDTAGPDPIRRSDGSTTDEAKARGRSQKEVDAEALAFASVDPIYNLGGFSRINPEAWQEFTAVLRDAARRGSCVAVVLMPYHPIVYEVLRTSPRYAVPLSIGHIVRAFADSSHMAVVGDYDPAKLGLTGADFEDGMHLMAAAASRIESDAIRICRDTRTPSG